MYSSLLKKKWVLNNVHVGNERNWCLLCSLFLFRFCLFFVLLFFFFAIVSFVTTTPDKFQFQIQEGLSQMNVIVPNLLKFKLYAVFIEWGSRIDFLFMGQQNIVNYWDFPARLPETATKCWYRKKLDLINEIFCKHVSSRPTDWFAGFVGRILLAVLLLLPLPNCFLRLRLSTLFAAVLKFLLSLTTVAISGATNSNKSALMRFAAGTMYSRKYGFCSSPDNFCKCTKSPSTLSTNTSIEWNLYLSWSNHLVTSFRLEMNVGRFCEHQNKASDTDRYKG